VGPRLLCAGLCTYLRTDPDVHLLECLDSLEVTAAPAADVLVLIATNVMASLLSLQRPQQHALPTAFHRHRRRTKSSLSLPPVVLVTDTCSISSSASAELRAYTPRLLLVSYHEEPGALCRAIQSIFRGALFPSDTQRSPPVPTIPVPILASTGLTERQQEVAILAADGFSNDEIGIQLFVDVTTVKSHLTEVFRKLGICRRSQIIGKLAPERAQGYAEKSSLHRH
jgi:DNA-binding NarL/FixJ family response regulator